MNSLEEGLTFCAFIDQGFRLGTILTIDRVHLKLFRLERRGGGSGGNGRETEREGGRRERDDTFNL